MAHGDSATAINEAVRTIMMAKPLNTLNGYPNMESVYQLDEQVAKFCASVRTTSWGRRHGYLALALSNYAPSTYTKGTITVSALRKLDKINTATKL